MVKIAELKTRLQNLILRYQQREFSIWDFSSLQVYPHSLSIASVPEGEKRNNNFSHLMQAISVIEGELIKVVDDNPDQRAQLIKFLNCKIFSSLEHMRVEMELRYKAQQVFLTTNDKTRLHGYWVPCQAAYLEMMAQQDSNSDSDNDELHQPKTITNFPCMIFCNPNAGYAEFF